MNHRLRDAFDLSVDMMKDIESAEPVGRVGFGTVELSDRLGRLISATPFANLITDAGDLYYATMCISGVSPSLTSAPTLVNGMKLGTGTTAVTKASTAAALITYLTASNVAFDSSYPATSNLGSGLGVNCVYKTTWGAGVATSSAITEAVIVNDRATNATTSAANTICRTVFTAQNKGASDTLAITWNHKNLGA